MIWKLALNVTLGMKHILLCLRDCGCGVICHCGISAGPLLHSGDPMSTYFDS